MNLPREIFDEFALGKSVLPRLKSVVWSQLITEYFQLKRLGKFTHSEYTYSCQWVSFTQYFCVNLLTIMGHYGYNADLLSILSSVYSAFLLCKSGEGR